MAMAQENDNMFANDGLVDNQGNPVGDQQQQQQNDDAANPNQPIQLWTPVHKHHTLAADGSLFGFVYSIGGNDLACQIQRKYGKFSIVIGCFKYSISGGAPIPYNSESFLTKKGMVVLLPENFEALIQLVPTLKKELAVLEAKIGINAQ